MKELSEEFEIQFSCLGESTKKHVTFPFLMEKEVTRIGKNGQKISKNMSYILQFIDSASFIRSSLSNLSLKIILRESGKLNVNIDTMIKKCETCGVRYKYCDSFLEYTNSTYNLIEYVRLCCNKKCQQNFHKKIKGILLPQKEDFYSHLKKEDITDAIYAHAKSVRKDFETKNIGRIS